MFYRYLILFLLFPLYIPAADVLFRHLCGHHSLLKLVQLVFPVSELL